MVTNDLPLDSALWRLLEAKKDISTRSRVSAQSCIVDSGSSPETDGTWNYKPKLFYKSSSCRVRGTLTWCQDAPLPVRWSFLHNPGRGNIKYSRHMIGITQFCQHVAFEVIKFWNLVPGVHVFKDPKGKILWVWERLRVPRRKINLQDKFVTGKRAATQLSRTCRDELLFPMPVSDVSYSLGWIGFKHFTKRRQRRRWGCISELNGSESGGHRGSMGTGGRAWGRHVRQKPTAHLNQRGAGLQRCVLCLLAAIALCTTYSDRQSKDCTTLYCLWSLHLKWSRKINDIIRLQKNQDWGWRFETG